MWFGLHKTLSSAETFLKDKAHGEWKIVTLYPVRDVNDTSLPEPSGYLVIPSDISLQGW